MKNLNLTRLLLATIAVIAQATNVHAQELVLRSADQMPLFPGGKAALMKCISRNMVIPDTTLELEGRFVSIMQFVVTKTGEIGEVKVGRSSHPFVDTIAINAIKALPNFVPARQDGKPVNEWYTIPVTMVFENEDLSQHLVDSTHPEQQITLIDANKGIFESVDSMGRRHIEELARYPGGDAALIQHLHKNLRYPEVARLNGVMGDVVVQFVISATGKVGKIEVIKSAHPSLNSEAMRLCKTLSDFVPAKRDGVPVESTYTLPMRFRLNNDDYVDSADSGFKRNPRTRFRGVERGSQKHSGAVRSNLP